MACGADKLILLPMCRPPWVLILWLSGHQTQMVVWIDLLQPCMRAVVSEVGTVGYSELAMKGLKNSHALLCMMCNVVRVTAQFGYMSDKSVEGHGHVWWCQECG